MKIGRCWILVIFHINVVLSQLPTQQHIDALSTYILPRQCHENDPNFSECARSMLEYLLQRTNIGFDGTTVPLLDPLNITSMNFVINNNLIQVAATINNISMRGLSGAQLSRVSFVTTSTVYTEVEGVLPQVHVRGNIIIDSLLLNNINVSPRGPFELTINNLSFQVRENSDVYEREGHTYMRPTISQVNLIDLGDIRLRADNLIADPLINNLVVNFVNTNWRQFYRSIIEEARPQVEGVFLEIVNYYWPHVPLDLMLASN